MRFALSAVAATSGVFLLGLAFYGQPALYLHQVRDELGHLLAGPGADQPGIDAPVDPDRDAVNERMMALQQQVARLRDELAARQALDAQPAAPARPKPDPAPRSAPPEPSQAVLAPPGPLKPGPSTALAAQLPLATMVVPPAGAASEPAEAPQLDWLAPSNAAASVPPAIVTPLRREPAAAEPAPPKPEQPKPEMARIEPPRQEPAKNEPAKPVAQKTAIAKPPPAPPPQPSPPRQEVDDTQSVLARLRQIAPATVQQAEPPAPAEQKLPEPRPPLPPSPSLPKLTLARAALAAGRIDDARRLLQEAQLQLVFRPVNATGDELPSAGRGAADVAHALEALSANNIPLSRRYIDIASDDLSGNRTNQSVQVPEVRATGYAPAYPPR